MEGMRRGLGILTFVEMTSVTRAREFYKECLWVLVGRLEQPQHTHPPSPTRSFSTVHRLLLKVIRQYQPLSGLSSPSSA